MGLFIDMLVKDVSTLKQLKSAAQQLKPQLKAGDVIYLIGDLGAGKTTFTQMLLAACGVKEAVKSPTYTLYEGYQGNQQSYIHMDLYRLTDPEELYFLGIEDILDGKQIVLIEWPAKGRGVLPEADWTLSFKLNKQKRNLTMVAK